MNYPAASGRGIGPLIQLEALNIWLFTFLFLALILKNAAERRGMYPKIESNAYRRAKDLDKLAYPPAFSKVTAYRRPRAGENMGCPNPCSFYFGETKEFIMCNQVFHIP